MTAWKIGVAQGVVSEGEGGGACVQLAIGARLMQKPWRKSKGTLEKGEGCGHVGHVDDGVAKLHGEPRVRRSPHSA